VVGIFKLNFGLKIILVIVILGMLSLYFFWNPEVDIFPKCPFYSLTGIYCPGCGSQRATHQILHGYFIEGLRHNYLIGLLGIILVYELFVFVANKFFMKSIYNLLHNSKITIGILIIIILFWILRNINIFPFNELAP
jgi:Protein of unknown function (DUF2752)